MFDMIDRERLAAVAHGDVATQVEILAEFRRINEKDVSLLHQAAGQGDFSAISVLAHRMKGACMMLGATRFAETCSLVYMAARALDRKAVEDALVTLERELAELNRYLGGLCDGELSALLPLPDSHHPPEYPLLCSDLRFLVVEDHAFQRNLIIRFLQRLGASEVRGLGDGGAALAALDAQAADIMVLDLAMPGVDGMDVIRALGVARHRISLIINSALSPSLMASLIQMTRNYRVDLLGTVSKPLTESTLSPLIAKFRAGGTALQ